MKKHFFLIYTFFGVIISGLLLAHDHYDHYDHYQHIECSIIPIAQKESTSENMPAHISHPHIPGPRSSRVAGNIATSTNWCGYVGAKSLSSLTKNSVSAVSGSWIVPKLVSTPDNSYSAIWVGIDGYNSPSVEQIGTSHNWSNGVQQNYTWFEMYPHGAFVIGGFPLSPGDVISASVVYSGNFTFILKIANDTKQVFFTVPTSYTRSTTALRSCAEWIVEAPYLNGILPLADFVTAYLWGCMATINGITAPVNNGSWKYIAVEMVTNNSTPKAIPSSLLPDNGSFFVTWAHE